MMNNPSKKVETYFHINPEKETIQSHNLMVAFMTVQARKTLGFVVHCRIRDYKKCVRKKNR